MPTAVVINGPNLNRLGLREPEIYGTASLGQILARVRARAKDLGWELEVFQSNHEGDLIDEIQRVADESFDGIIINPGALTHYSYALHDALRSVDVPAVEVHLTDIENREEEWRRESVTAAACVAMIAGKGPDGYVEALELLASRVQATPDGSPAEVAS
jgi:3-dehydroquinate dehydratase-2